MDRIVDGRRFQSLKAAQLNVLTFGDANKIQVMIGLKSYLNGGRTDIN